MDVYLYVFMAIMLVVGCYALLTTLLNIKHFKKLGNVQDLHDGPLVSVVVPARDEEKNIGRLLESLINQSYKNIEILVINDQSTDRTEEIIKSYSQRDSRVHYFETVPGQKLSKNGKINALLHIMPYAKGEYILATDADTVHAAECIAHSYAIMKKESLDIISGFPTEICPTFMGTVNISAMLLTNVFIPHYFVYRFPIPSACFAIGQFIMMRRNAYESTGGYSCIKGSICDDVGIVRLFVKNKKKYAMVSICNYVRCYMYSNTKEAFRGIERSIAGVIPPKVSTLVPVAIVVIALFHMGLCPIIAILLYIATNNTFAFWALIFGWLLFYLAWYISCRSTNSKKRISFACPLTVIQIAIMYLHAVYMQLSGKGFVWKGRPIK